MTTTSVGYDGSINELQWASLSEELGAVYSVKNPGDWAVSTVVGQDRTVSIAAGVGYGRGVQDTTTTAVTVQLPTVASGSRWDTVVMHRDWQPPGGTSVMTSLTGTATQAVAASRAVNPGVLDDQLLALVQVTAGQQLPTAVIDLRSWSSKVVTANSLLALPNAPLGKEVVVANIRYRRQLDATQALVWVAAPRDPESGHVTHNYGGGLGPVTANVVFAKPFAAPPAIGLGCTTYVLQPYYVYLSATGVTIASRGAGGVVPPSGSYQISWTATGQ